MPQIKLDGEPVEPYTDCHAAFVHVFDQISMDNDLWVRSLCTRAWCSRCEPIRLFRIERKLRSYVEGHPDSFWRFVTISVKNERSFSKATEALSDAWGRFTMSARNRERRGQQHSYHDIKYYMGWKEVTHSARTGFNVHWHMLVGTQGSFWDYKSCHADWNLAAGYEATWNEQPLVDLESAVRYVSKYVHKDGFFGGLSRRDAFLYSGDLQRWNRTFTKRGTAVKKRPTDVAFCCSSDFREDCQYYHNDHF